MIREPYIAPERVRQALGGSEAGGGQHLADAAIEAIDHAVGLGMTGFDEAVLKDPIEAVLASRVPFAGGAKAIGEFLTIIGQDFLHSEGRLRDGSLEKGEGKDWLIEAKFNCTQKYNAIAHQAFRKRHDLSNYYWP